jgi:hypothetical protein
MLPSEIKTQHYKYLIFSTLHNTFTTTFKIYLSSLSLKHKQMEAISFCDCNKENIPPPLSTKRINPVPANAPSSKKTNKRRSRKPLADITNLLYYPVLPSSIPQPQSVYLLLSSSASVSTSNPRKRKAIPKVDSVQVPTSSNSKSLRMGFR